MRASLFTAALLLIGVAPGPSAAFLRHDPPPAGATDVLFRNADCPVTRDGKDTRALVFADVDGDGRVDLLAANFAQSSNLYRNLGGGRWQVQSGGPALAEAARTTGAAFGDVDGDGDPDLYLTRGHGEDNALCVNQGGQQGGAPGSFARATRGDAVTGGDSQAAVFGDLDGDGDQDLLVAHRFESSVLYWNDGRGGFTRAQGSALEQDCGASRAVALGDLDGDGDLDVVIANSNGEDEFLYINQGGRQGGLAGELLRVRDDPAARAGGDTFGLALGDLDGDADLDLVLANRDEPSLVFLNDGGGSFARGPALAPDAADSCGAAIADLDADGDRDVVLANRRQACSLFLNHRGAFVSGRGGALTALAGDSRAVACGDVDGDGLPELAIANGLGGDDFLMLNGGRAWRDLGHALAGGGFAPELSGGDLGGGRPFSLECRGAPPFAASWVVIGRGRVDAPFKGGMLVPSPDVLLPGPTTDATGTLQWRAPWPEGVPSRTTLYAQCWLGGPGPAGCLASNAVSANTP